jgi:RNA polymerase sigma factor (TIGR02999 family)
MNEVTRILSAMGQGDNDAPAQLLPLVYEELRRLARDRVSRENPGQTLQATVLVHEAYLRLVDVDEPQRWHGRGHFFAAAAEAMRRILIEAARRKQCVKHGGERKRVDLDAAAVVAAVDAADSSADDLLELDAALERLAASDPQSAQVVKLRYFGGLTIPQAAETMGVSPRKVDLLWSFARAWLRREMSGN